MHPSRSTRNFDDRLNKTQTPLFKVFSENNIKKKIDETDVHFFLYEVNNVNDDK